MAVMKVIDWEQREFELIKAAMVGLMSTLTHFESHSGSAVESISEYSIMQAQDLIKKLKKERYEKD